MKIDYSIPEYIKNTLQRISDLVDYNNEIDGFDSTYYDGAADFFEILEDWDFGLSESYIKGLKRALEIYEEEKNKNVVT